MIRPDPSNAPCAATQSLRRGVGTRPGSRCERCRSGRTSGAAALRQFLAGPCGSKMNFSVFQSPSGVSGSRLPCVCSDLAVQGPLRVAIGEEQVTAFEVPRRESLPAALRSIEVALRCRGVRAGGGNGRCRHHEHCSWERNHAFPLSKQDGWSRPGNSSRSNDTVPRPRRQARGLPEIQRCLGRDAAADPPLQRRAGAMPENRHSRCHRRPRQPRPTQSSFPIRRAGTRAWRARAKRVRRRSASARRVRSCTPRRLTQPNT